MPLPLAVLRATQNQPMMVELKNGDTLSGVLTSCDGFMNLHLKDLVCTSRDGDRFWKIPEAYVRGNNVKYLRLPDEVLDIASQTPTVQEKQPGRSKGDWQQGGRGRGRGRGAIDLKQHRGEGGETKRKQSRPK